MRTGFLPIIALVAATCLCGSAYATDYYVSTSGDDGKDGLTPGTAWRHINHAAQQAEAGDTVLVLEGTYSERVQIRGKSGTAEAPITLRSSPGDTVTIDGANVSFPQNHSDALFEILGCSHVIVDGIRVINSSNVGIVCRGPASTNITVRNCSTYNTVSSGIAAWGGTRNPGNYNGIRQILIEDNEVELAMNGVGYQECLTVAGGVDGFTIRNNHVHHGGAGTADGGPLGIDAKFGVRNGEISGNHVHHIQSSGGIYVDAWTTHTYTIKIHGNIVHHCDDAGIQVGGEQGGNVSNIDIYNNLVYDNGGTCTGVRDHSWGSGISIHHGEGEFTNINVYNNTVHHNNVINQYNCGGIGIYHPTATGSVMNNIVSDNVMSQILMGIIEENTVMVVDRNLIDGYAGQHNLERKGASPIVADPQFVNGAARDLRLQASSPAIDACNPALVPSSDYDGVSRPQGDGHDIGAYEHKDGRPMASGTECSGDQPSGNPPHSSASPSL
jgi:hypothetical protein